jgi:diguanylate cyclase (GGDEF)-like protein
MKKIRMFGVEEHESAVLFNGSKKALYFILAVSYSSLFLFGVKGFYLGDFLLGASLILFVTLAMIDTIAVIQNKPPVVHINLVVCVLLLSHALSIYYIGIGAVFWAFPVSIALAYLLPRREMLLFNTAIFIYVCGFFWFNDEFTFVYRFALSLLLTMVFSSAVATYIQELHKNLKYDSTRDPLTGALNRRQLATHLENCIALKKRSDLDSAILMIDIDRFKQINDNFGHNIGDKVIVELTGMVNESTREVDQLFRFGGEEFVLLLHNINVENAQKFAEKLRHKIESTYVVEIYPITVSIGVSVISSDYDVDTWIKAADVALYDAKNSGRNQVKLYSPSDDDTQEPLAV